MAMDDRDYASMSRSSTLEDESAVLVRMHVRELDEPAASSTCTSAAASHMHSSGMCIRVLEDARAACVPRLSVQQQRSATLCLVFCALVRPNPPVKDVPWYPPEH